MSINGIGTSPYAALGYETRKAQQTAATNNTADSSFASNMNTVQKSQMPGGAFVFHYFDSEDGERAVSAACGADYSVTVYEPKDFDPSNPVYKVKVWDKDGNVVERMVDISKVDPTNCDYIDMYAYSCYLGDEKGCKDAISSFMGAGVTANENWLEGWSYDDLFSKRNWIKAVKDMMQMQYDAGNLQGYLDYKRFLDAIDDDRKERAERKEQIDKEREETEKKQNEEENKTDSEIIVKPDGSQVLVTTTTIGETQVSMSLEIAKPTG
ncbi:MAG: hypothetical protein J1E98_05625 [Lachnospiraceae bacterium]|nr:hypothetical protein [Lachnospiraceae bacterium]